MSTPPVGKRVAAGTKARRELSPLLRQLEELEKDWTLNITAAEATDTLACIEAAHWSHAKKGSARTRLIERIDDAIAAVDDAHGIGLPPLLPQAKADPQPANGAASSTAAAPLSSLPPSAATAVGDALTAVVDALATMPMPRMHAAPTTTAGYAADVMHEAVACGDEPATLRACFAMLAQDGYRMEQLYADTSIRSAMAADFSGDDTRLLRELRELYHQAGLPMPTFGSTSDGGGNSGGISSGMAHVPLPDMPMPNVPSFAPTFAPGMQVQLHGLVGRADLNGVCGILQARTPNGRWAVQVPSGGILVKPQNLHLLHEVCARRLHVHMCAPTLTQCASVPCTGC